MAENQPTLEEWRRLYEAAARIKEIAPWEWLMEDDLFGVQNPETSEFGFVSVMGTLGEHFAISVYLGSEGLYGFWDLEEAGPFGNAEQVLEIPQLQASFEDRNELREQDRDLIKQLGLKFRGRQAWPMFRSFRPGFVPWFLEAAEVRFLTYVLEQTIDVAQRSQTDPALLEPPDDETYLMRVPQPAGTGLVWSDQLMAVPPPQETSISIRMDMQALAALKSAPRGRQTLEADFFMLPMATQEERGARPYYPYMLLVVEQQSGMILGTEMLKPESTLTDMWGLIPLHLVRQLHRIGLVPKEIKVRSPLLLQLVQPLAGELGFKLKQSNKLSKLDSAKEFLFQRFW